MGTFGEIFDTFQSRVRSPIFGSIAVAFVIFNWQPLFYLVFENAGATDKFNFFEANTTVKSKYVWPIIAGLIFATSAPWIAFASSWIASKPTLLLRAHQLRQRNETKTLELSLKIQREKQFAEGAAELTKKALERSEKTEEIEDPQTKEDLQKQIEGLRELTLSIGAGEGEIPPRNTPRELEAYYRSEIGRLTTKLNSVIDRFNEKGAKGDIGIIKSLSDSITELYIKLAEHLEKNN